MMAGHHHHHGHSSHRRGKHDGTKRAEEQRDDQEYRERMIKELKERRGRKERRRRAREALESETGKPWWFEMNDSEDQARKWMVEEREDKELRNADEWNKAQELKKITGFFYDKERKRFALAEVESKWNTTKAKRDVKKRERDQILEEAWNREFFRWNDELDIAGSNDDRYETPDEDGVIWSPQSLLDINNDIRKRHLARCMPSLQKPDSRGTHCKDCEDEQEVGHFWDEVRRLGL
ncbi:uncharacterized protein EAF02_001343 [Botrytis sinoallii]|uniref:uncharacterized protein n=1 Tax=Botrytis sinoallii TaxID=1463999 RepID=UPI001902A24F|nr:uncharacterized protein EAF02_001343 [Botrytis sinoallii]KAF7891018.1 hypothetical protein EAF02_001343 [Botrytis sinoallii]